MRYFGAADFTRWVWVYVNLYPVFRKRNRSAKYHNEIVKYADLVLGVLWRLAMAARVCRCGNS
jgi:hypothetical protein